MAGMMNLMPNQCFSGALIRAVVKKTGKGMPFPIKIFIFATVRCFPAWRSLSCCVSVCDARNVCVCVYTKFRNRQTFVG